MKNKSVFNQVMLDLETMGTDENFVILSVGMVKFNIDTGEIGNKLHLKISINDSLKKGFKIDGNTLIWWLNNDKKAKEMINKGEKFSINNTLDYISEFLNKDLEIWAKSPSFDCNLLKSYYQKLNRNIPWNFRNQQDVRTLINLNKKLYEEITKDVKITHDAIDDCINQINYYHQIYKSLKIK